MTTVAAKASKERPIILGPADVRSVLDGTKTHLWQVVSPAPVPRDGHPGEWLRLKQGNGACWDSNRRLREVRDRRTRKLLRSDEYLVPFEEWLIGLCPLGEVGDQLWVRETFALRADIDPERERERALHYIVYRADRESGDNLEMDWHGYGRGWRASTTMPRWASRLTLQITRVSLDDISHWRVEFKREEAGPT